MNDLDLNMIDKHALDDVGVSVFTEEQIEQIKQIVNEEINKVSQIYFYQATSLTDKQKDAFIKSFKELNNIPNRIFKI